MEKFTPLHPSITFLAQFFKPFMKNEYFHRIVKFKLEGDNIWLEKGWKDVVANCGIKQNNFLFFKYAGDSKFQLGIVDNKGKPLCCTCKRGIADAEHVVINEQTLCYTKIRKSVHGAKQPLNIMSHIVRAWFNGKPNNVDIMLPSGEKERWTLLWCEPSGNVKPRPNKCLIGHGWYEFAKKTELPIGQHIRFYNRSSEPFLRIDIIQGECSKVGFCLENL